MLKEYESYPCKVELGLNTNIVPLLFILCPQDLNLRWLQRAGPRVSMMGWIQGKSEETRINSI